jgi:phosphoribosyl 1,2-cyclic phosphodiesterase
MLKIAFVNDFMGTSKQTPEEEYNEFVQDVTSAIKDIEDLEIERFDNVGDAIDGYFNSLVVDYGGLVGIGCDGMVNSNIRDLARAIADNPNKYFILNSRMCAGYLREDLDDLGININECPNLSVSPHWIPDAIKQWITDGTAEFHRVY